MAEVLGIVAGGMGITSLAIQIGDSIIRLKEFWSAVKDAPEEVKYLIEEIETLNLVLSEMTAAGNGEDGAQIGSTALMKCLELGKKGAEILSTVVKQVEQEIGKRKRFGSIRMALRKGSIDFLRDKLKTAQLMLMLSNQTYSEALQKRRHELQRQWAELHQQELSEFKLVLTRDGSRQLCPHSNDLPAVVSASGFVDVNESLEERVDNRVATDSDNLFQAMEDDLTKNMQQVTYVSKRRKRLIARLQTPSWLWFSKNAWEACCYKANSGWMFMAQPYRLVPWNSPVMRFAKDGHVKGIQELFSKKLASPYDRQSDGWTVLDHSRRTLISYANKIAAHNQRIEVCHLLLDEGADPNISAHSSALHFANCGWHYQSQRFPLNAAVELVRCLAPYIDKDIFDIDSGELLQLGNPKSFEWLLNQSTITCKERTLQERLDIIAASLSSYLTPSMPSLVRISLGGKHLDRTVSTYRDEFGETLLHYVTNYLGEYYAIGAIKYRGEKFCNQHFKSYDLDAHINFWTLWSQPQLNENFVLMQDLILTGACLFRRSYQLQTPLLQVCRGIERVQVTKESCDINLDYRARSWKTIIAQIFEESIQVWLDQLAKAGIDLMDYGRRESRIHMKRRVVKQWDFYDEFLYSPTFKKKIFTLQLIGFTYGPLPEDWKFWFTEAMDSSFLEFWHMADHPELGIPGAWDDYDESEDNYYLSEESEDDNSDYESSEYWESDSYKSDDGRSADRGE